MYNVNSHENEGRNINQKYVAKLLTGSSVNIAITELQKSHNHIQHFAVHSQTDEINLEALTQFILPSIQSDTCAWYQKSPSDEFIVASEN